MNLAVQNYNREGGRNEPVISAFPYYITCANDFIIVAISKDAVKSLNL